MGRRAFDRREWPEAYRFLSSAAGEEQLAAEDLERLAVAAYLVGHEQDSTTAWVDAHRGYLGQDEPAAAALVLFWLGVTLLLRGASAQGGGWLARGARILESSSDDAVRAYYLLPSFLEARGAGDVDAALAISAQLMERAGTADDRDLLALALLCRGQALVLSGDSSGGLRTLDETMVSLAFGEVSPVATGLVYCAVIETCMHAYDIRRAVEWTAALSSWCAAQPGLVPYRGQCLIHRSQVLQHHGEWPAAAAEAAAAETVLRDPPHPVLGLAHYRAAELYRLRGDLGHAEKAFAEASRHGCPPDPGLALLRLAQGDTGTAVAMARRFLEDHSDPTARPLLLAAVVEIMRRSGEVATAAAASEELARVAAASGSEMLGALADQAAADVLLAEGHPGSALKRARSAGEHWMELEAPYELAGARTLAGLACAAMGDHTSAELELGAALATYRSLGARADVARVEALLGNSATDPHQLTGRECEVLRGVASGRTNQEIADELAISPHTVARHLQNIFAKIGTGSRSAATAYAYEHHLL